MALSNNSELTVLESRYDGVIYDYGYLNQIYSNLNGYINNPIGTIALMANLYAESRCSPNRLQGDVYGAPTSISINYTNNVDDGNYTRAQFISDQKGYGLAQWTIVARKTLYYDYAPIQSVGIGDIQRGLGYLHAELRGDYASQGIDYSNVLTACQNATDLHNCTDYVLDNFENPLIPNYSEREQIADDLWTWFFGTTNSVSVSTSGNGTAYVDNTHPADGEQFTLYADPATGETLESIDAWDAHGYSIAMEQYTPYTYTYNSGWGNYISILVSFSGTPPTPPTPTVRKEKHNMPIWMYPRFRC